MRKLTQFDIEECMKDMTGDYHLKDLMLLLQLKTEMYAHLKTAVNRACKKGIAKPVGRWTGTYRTIDREFDYLNYKRKNPEGFFDIKYPFGLEEYVRTPRRSVVVIGGSPGAGKTAMAHNIIAMNAGKHRVVLFDSENSEAEIQERLSKHDGYMDWPDDLVRSRSSDFEDVIEPDALNITDYLEVPENVWEVRTQLRRIRDKLNQGIAVVMLQKPEGRDLPYGKEWAKQLPRLVVAMEGGILKIIKGKSWVKNDVNPDGLRWSFKLLGGEKFVNILPLGKETK